jgi:L-amino acid N-acyltransferase YncA
LYYALDFAAIEATPSNFTVSWSLSPLLILFSPSLTIHCRAHTYLLNTATDRLQEAQERNPKGARWLPLKLEAVKDPPVMSSNSESWSVQQAAIPAASSPVHPGASQAASTTASNPASTSLHSHEKRRNRAPRSKTAVTMGANKLTLPKSAFIPPHLRTPAMKANVPAVEKNVVKVTNGSRVESNKPRAEHHHNLWASPTPRESPRASAITLRDSKPPKAEVQSSSPPNASEEPKAKKEFETTMAASGSWDTSFPAPAPAAPEFGNPRWPRVREPYKKMVWPKNKDMKALPTDSSSDGGVTFKSDSGGDPNYDVKKLMDWNGDWLPPPEQWAARRGHSSRHFGQQIEKWMDGQANVCLNPIDVASTNAFRENGCKDLVPTYWLPQTIEQEATGEFWKKFAGRTPAPLSEVDVFADPPYWERVCDDEDGLYIEALAVPDARVNPNDPDNYISGADLLVSVEVRIRGIMEQRASAERRRLARQKRPVPESTMSAAPLMPDRRIDPATNVYIRPVQPADVRGILEIYNYYVNTIHTNEFEAITEQHMQCRIHDSITAGLPFLVAIAKGKQSKERKGYVSERIIGYVHLDEYCGQSTIYRYTFDMKLYVHPGFVCQKIAQCLLDRILEMCNTSYHVRGGYEYRNDYEYLRNGPSRVIKTIMLTVHIEHGEKDTKAHEYLKPFKFYRAGHIPEIGYKNGKVVDKFLFRHTTSENVSPNSRPAV